MNKRKYIAYVLLILIIISGMPASANIEKMIPTEEEMGFNISEDEIAYKKFPSNHYGWDTAHKWFRMDGLTPKTGNTTELMSKGVLDSWMALNVAWTRISIFLLQFGFNNDLFEETMGSINDVMKPIKRFFYEETFWLAALVFSGILLILYAKGRKGESALFILKSVAYATIIFGVMDNIEWIFAFTVGLVDYLALLVMGVMNLAPIAGQNAAEHANQQIMVISNTIFRVYVELPWLFGQFNSLSDIPTVTHEEFRALEKDGIVATGDTWADLFLQFPTGSDEREIMVDILTNDKIQHSSSLDTTMLSGGAYDRMFTAFLSSLQSFTALIYYGLIGILNVLSKGGLIAATVSLPIFVIFSFFGSFGERWLQKMTSLWVWSAALKIAAAFFVGITMLISILITSEKYYLVTATLNFVVNCVSIFFIPSIWTRIAPAIIKGAARLGQEAKKIQSGNRFGKGQASHTSPPQVRSEMMRRNIPNRSPFGIKEREYTTMYGLARSAFQKTRTQSSPSSQTSKLVTEENISQVQDTVPNTTTSLSSNSSGGMRQQPSNYRSIVSRHRMVNRTRVAGKVGANVIRHAPNIAKGAGKVASVAASANPKAQLAIQGAKMVRHAPKIAKGVGKVASVAASANPKVQVAIQGAKMVRHAPKIAKGARKIASAASAANSKVQRRAPRSRTKTHTRRPIRRGR